MIADHEAADDELGEAAVVEQLAGDRFSCRAFQSRPVPRATIERWLTTAQRAPSWCNTQPWQTIVTDPAATSRLRAALRGHLTHHPHSCGPDLPPPRDYQGVYAERRRDVGWALYDAVGVQRGDRVASRRQSDLNFELFGAPHVAVVHVDAAQGPYGVLDAGVFLGTLLIAARSLGLDTITQASVAMHGTFVHDYFNLPSDRAVLVAMSFGYADLDHPANRFRSRRAHLAEAVRFDMDPNYT